MFECPQVAATTNPAHRQSTQTRLIHDLSWLDDRLVLPQLSHNLKRIFWTGQKSATHGNSALYSLSYSSRKRYISSHHLLTARWSVPMFETGCKNPEWYLEMAMSASEHWWARRLVSFYWEVNDLDSKGQPLVARSRHHQDCKAFFYTHISSVQSLGMEDYISKVQCDHTLLFCIFIHGFHFFIHDVFM